MKKQLIIILAFLPFLGFGQSGAKKMKYIESDFVKILDIKPETGVKTIAVDSLGNIVQDTIRVALKDSGAIYITPTELSQYATIDQLDQVAVIGLVKAPVDLCSAGENYDLSGEETLDGYGVVGGERVLLTNQTDLSENGIYDVNGSGAWTRATDFDETSEIYRSIIFVLHGDSLAGATYATDMSDSTGFVVDTDNLRFNLMQSTTVYIAGDALSLTGTTLDVKVDDETIEVRNDKLYVKSNGILDNHISAGVNPEKLGSGTISSTEYGYLNNLTGNIQTQLNAKVDTALISETAFGASWNGSDSLVRQDELYDKIISDNSASADSFAAHLALINSLEGETAKISHSAYNSSSWNGSDSIPDQNAIRDKIYIDSIFWKDAVDIDQISMNAAYSTTKVTLTNSYKNLVGSSNAPYVQINSANAALAGLMSSAMYNKMSGIESGAEVNQQANWAETDVNSDAYILNKPEIETGDTTFFDVSGAVNSMKLTTKSGISNITIDGDSTCNQLEIGSNYDVTHLYLKNENGNLSFMDQNKSGLLIDSDVGTLYVYKNGTRLYGFPNTVGTNDYVMSSTGSSSRMDWAPNGTGGTGGSGTVTSVDLTMPTDVFNVSGNPITTSGTFAITFDNQTSGTVFAAPSGSSGQPSFRALVDNDIPNTITCSYYLPLSAGSSYPLTGKLTGSSSGSLAPIRLPHRSTPSILENGDIWTTTAGVFARVNGATVALGGGVSGGVQTFTTTPATGLYDAGSATDPFPKVTINQLNNATPSLLDYVMLCDSSGSGTPKPLYKLTLSALKTTLSSGVTFEESDGSPSVDDVTTVVFDGATVTDDGGGQITVTIAAGGDPFEGFQELAGSGSITWSWLTDNNAYINDMDGNITLSFSNQGDGEVAELWLIPDTSTDYVLTLPSSNCFIANGHDNTFNILADATGDVMYVFTFKYSSGLGYTRVDYALYED